MNSGQAVVCAACGAKGRSNWDYCPRCGGSLANAKPEPSPSAALPADVDDDFGESRRSLVASLLTIAAILVCGVIVWRYATSQSADSTQHVGQGLFTLGPSPVPSPTLPPPLGVGALDFDAGRRLLSSRDLAGAVARLAAAVAADPGNAEYRSVYGYALWQAGDREQALQEQAQAAQLDPYLRLQYARSLDVAGRSADAVKVYESFLADNADAATVQEDLGRLLFRLGDYGKAAARLQASAKKRPDDAVLQQELAYSLDQSGDKAAAADVYRSVLQRAPGAVISRGLLSENLFQQGQKDEAVAVLEEGLRVSPDSPLLQRQMGSLLERTGRLSEAAAAFRQYAKLAPNAPDAGDMASRAALLEAAGKPSGS